jgi:predicted ATPase
MLARVAELANRTDYRHPYSRTWAALTTGLEYAYRLEAYPALAAAQQASEYCERYGFAQERSLALMLKAWSAFVVYGSSDAIDEFESAVADWRATGANLCQTWFASALVSMKIGCDRLTEAERDLKTALVDLEEFPEHGFAAELHRLLGDLTLMLHDTPDGIIRAEGSYYSAIEIARRQQAITLELRAATGLARLWQREGRDSDVSALLRELLDRFPTTVSTAELDAARQLVSESGG